jgi:hypothetical protein
MRNRIAGGAEKRLRRIDITSILYVGLEIQRVFFHNAKKTTPAANRNQEPPMKRGITGNWPVIVCTALCLCACGGGTGQQPAGDIRQPENPAPIPGEAPVETPGEKPPPPAEIIHPQKGKPPPTKEPAYIEAAMRYLASRGGNNGVNRPRETLLLVESAIDARGTRHLRFQQVHRNIPVYAHELRVHLTENRRVYRVDGRCTPIPPDFQASFSITEAGAGRLAEATNADAEWTAGEIKRYILVEESGRPRPALRVTLRKGLLHKYVFIDGDTGRILKTAAGTRY